MLRKVIWTCSFTKPVCWQNSAVIFGKSYLPHMTSLLAEIFSVYSTISQESKTIEFASIGLFVAPDIQVGMAEGQHWQIARFDFESCDFHDLPYFIFFP